MRRLQGRLLGDTKMTTASHEQLVMSFLPHSEAGPPVDQLELTFGDDSRSDQLTTNMPSEDEILMQLAPLVTDYLNLANRLAAEPESQFSRDMEALLTPALSISERVDVYREYQGLHQSAKKVLVIPKTEEEKVVTEIFNAVADFNSSVKDAIGKIIDSIDTALENNNKPDKNPLAVTAVEVPLKTVPIPKTESVVAAPVTATKPTIRKPILLPRELVSRPNRLTPVEAIPAKVQAQPKDTSKLDAPAASLKSGQLSTGHLRIIAEAVKNNPSQNLLKVDYDNAVKVVEIARQHLIERWEARSHTPLITVAIDRERIKRDALTAGLVGTFAAVVIAGSLSSQNTHSTEYRRPNVVSTLEVIGADGKKTVESMDQVVEPPIDKISMDKVAVLTTFVDSVSRQVNNKPPVTANHPLGKQVITYLTSKMAEHIAAMPASTPPAVVKFAEAQAALILLTAQHPAAFTDAQRQAFANPETTFQQQQKPNIEKLLLAGKTGIDTGVVAGLVAKWQDLTYTADQKAGALAAAHDALAQQAKSAEAAAATPKQPDSQTTPPASVEPAPTPVLPEAPPTPPTPPAPTPAPPITRSPDNTAPPTFETKHGADPGLASDQGIPENIRLLIIKYSAQSLHYTAAEIAAQLKIESNFNPNARSPAGAEGAAQMMPPTWAGLGRDVNGDGSASPFDPADAIDAQVRMMDGAYDNFAALKLELGADFDVKAAAAMAYNWGSSILTSYVKQFKRLPTMSDVGQSFTYTHGSVSEQQHVPSEAASYPGKIANIVARYTPNQTVPVPAQPITPPSQPVPIEKLKQSTEVIPCPAGVTDVGMHDGFFKEVVDGNTQHVKRLIRLCAVPGFMSTSEESVPGSDFYIQGANNNVLVNADIAQNMLDLFNAAKADGVDLNSVSSYRTNEHQTKLWNNNRNPLEVAPPGNSNHQGGRAWDANLNLGAGLSATSFPTQNGSAASPSNPRVAPNSKVWVWLTTNAGKYGFTQYWNEPWHWEIVTK